MPKPSTIADCMRRNPLTILHHANIVEAVELIVKHKLTGLTVTDDDGNAVGVLSELDCIAAILTAIYNEGDPGQAVVSEAMSCDMQVCQPADSIVEVAQSMLESRQRRRPVLVDGKLVGQVSSSNILWALMEFSRWKSTDSSR